MSNKKLLTLLISAVIVIWLATPFLVSMLHAGMPERGQFGDLYGSVNALFSGLAFAGLFYTIYLQTKQIRLQQSELKTQRQELRLQREEMVASRGELRLQVQMQQALIQATISQIKVASINAVIEAIKMDSESVNASGRDRFKTKIQDEANKLEKIANNLFEKIPEIE
jgi:hypothetical protein